MQAIQSFLSRGSTDSSASSSTQGSSLSRDSAAVYSGQQSSGVLAFATGFVSNLQQKSSDLKNAIGNQVTSVQETAESYTYIVILIIAGAIFIGLSLFYLPFILVMPKKFCGLFTLGSICLFASLFMMKGFREMISILFSREKALYSTAYVASLLVGVYSGILTDGSFLVVLVSCVAQVSFFRRKTETILEG